MSGLLQPISRRHVVEGDVLFYCDPSRSIMYPVCIKCVPETGLLEAIRVGETAVERLDERLLFVCTDPDTTTKALGLNDEFFIAAGALSAVKHSLDALDNFSTLHKNARGTVQSIERLLPGVDAPILDELKSSGEHFLRSLYAIHTRAHQDGSKRLYAAELRLRQAEFALVALYDELRPLYVLALEPAPPAAPAPPQAKRARVR